jgi:hypothetical protein
MATSSVLRAMSQNERRDTGAIGQGAKISDVIQADQEVISILKQWVNPV